MADGQADSVRARGGEPPLTVELLLWAYAQGFFPMSREGSKWEVDWYNPEWRAVLPLDGLKCSPSLLKRIRRGEFEIRVDSDFDGVVRSCASVRPDRCGTWINDAIMEGYGALHRAGWAHSVEAWREGLLVGGLYGVSIGGAFFGESMFCRPELGGTDASKVCLHHLVERMRRRGYVLLDTQIINDHMKRMGAVEVSRVVYMRRLARAVRMEVRWESE